MTRFKKRFRRENTVKLVQAVEELLAEAQSTGYQLPETGEKLLRIDIPSGELSNLNQLIGRFYDEAKRG